MINKTEQKNDPAQYIINEMLKRARKLAETKGVIKNIGILLGKAGIIGEDKNRVFAYLVGFSHKLKEPLNLLIQGSSGSGKTRLLRVISECIPPEKVIRLTRVSDKGFYNYPEDYLKNKLFALEDADGLSEEADFAYRELISNNELISNVSIKDENGKNTTGEKKVSGPIASMACTTNGNIYEDNISRMFVITVDESEEQSKRIISYQNAKSAGKINKKQEKEARLLLQHLARVLKPYEVINPYADKVNLPDDVHKKRRLNELFKEFIHIITVVNQYQRKTDNYGRLITEPEDIKTAIDIMFDCIVLKVDELDGSLRQFFEKLKTYLKTKEKPEKYRFTQREIRHELKLSKASLSRYISDLVKLEYIQELSGNNKRKVCYSIEYWDNYQSLRSRIKNHLYDQLNKLTNNNKDDDKTNENK
jgi:DNA-binding MarR family transcriptional regulator